MSTRRLRPLKIPLKATVANLLVTPHWNRFAGDPDSELKRENINKKSNNKKKSGQDFDEGKARRRNRRGRCCCQPYCTVTAASPPDEINGLQLNGAEDNDIEGSGIGKSDAEDSDAEDGDTDDSDDEGQDTLELEWSRPRVAILKSKMKSTIGPLLKTMIRSLLLASKHLVRLANASKMRQGPHTEDHFSFPQKVASPPAFLAFWPSSPFCLVPAVSQTRNPSFETLLAARKQAY
ncbi:hypothetical protein QR685DRAFT_566089 [Neurospora intermedia]|uniref:Uncharacterized protein n=1 Tax=Neurospora intermedia TaxID=5142 RepID=A0ABR3D0Q0_NEUIN